MASSSTATENAAAPGGGRYRVFYDGDCRLCIASVRTLREWATGGDVRFVNIQDRAALARFPMVDPKAAQGQMFVLAPDGALAGGFDGIVSLLPAIPSLSALAPVLRWAPMRRLGRWGYRLIARNRFRIAGRAGCDGGTCRIA